MTWFIKSRTLLFNVYKINVYNMFIFIFNHAIISRIEERPTKIGSNNLLWTTILSI